MVSCDIVSPDCVSLHRSTLKIDEGGSTFWNGRLQAFAFSCGHILDDPGNLSSELVLYCTERASCGIAGPY